ncbi:uncharacterized protein METZ01_LOCUS263528 [marine metagenome]|uniref:Fe2OG dioxygenase domain-containing protein n=1 Tax=marine metagenome TaxID=408172 RepID=A0A382JED4_9ZZZZ
MARQNKHLHKVTALKIFTPDECADIIKDALNNWIEEEGTLSNSVKDLDLRNTTLFIPPKSDKEHVWCKKIINTITSFNNDKEGYGFDIVDDWCQTPSMLRYMSADINPNKKVGKYDWHMDVGSRPLESMRKLSYSILLNVGEYEGGELEFHTGKYLMVNPSKPSDALGSMTLFPSYLIHRVLPVTKGIRYVMVGWMSGPSFR